MKKWQSIFLILGIIFGCLLCITNIVLAVIFSSVGANIFTAISGWISGIATIILGIIAVWQNKLYQSQSDKNRLLSDLKYEVDLVDEIYFKYIVSCDSAILIFNVQRLNRQDNDVYFDNIIKFQMALSKTIGLIYNKTNTMKYYIKSDLCNLLQEYYDTIDENVDNWQRLKYIDSTDIEEISEIFEKTREEFINYNAKIGEFYNNSLKKTPKQLLFEIDNMISERNKHIGYKIQKEKTEDEVHPDE